MRPVSDRIFLGLYSSSHFLAHIPSKLLAALIFLIPQHYNLNLAQYALIATTIGFAEGLSSPLCGILADRFNKRRFPPFGIILMGASTLIIGIFGRLSIYIFLSCLLILSFSSALFHTSGMTLISERFPKDRSKAFSIFSMGGQAGMGVGPLTLAILLWLDIKDPFLVYLLWSIPILFVSIAMLITHTKDTTIEISSDLKTRNESETIESEFPSFSVKKALLVSSFLILLLITALIGFGRKLFDQYFVYFLVAERQITEPSADFYYAMLTILGLPGNYLGGLAGDKYGERHILMIAHSLTVLGLLVLLLVQTTLMIPLVFLLLSFGKNIAMPNSHSLTARIVPLKARGKAYGFLRWDTTALGSLAPIIGASIILNINPMAIFLISNRSLVLILPAKKSLNSLSISANCFSICGVVTSSSS